MVAVGTNRGSLAYQVERRCVALYGLQHSYSLSLVKNLAKLCSAAAAVEKFYCYIEWLVYIVTKILEPAGYKLTGTVDWQGEDDDDIGIISVDENGIIKSQKACDAPKWKVWTADDISVKPQVCLRCRVQREQDPDCQGTLLQHPLLFGHGLTELIQLFLCVPNTNNARQAVKH